MSRIWRTDVIFAREEIALLTLDRVSLPSSRGVPALSMPSWSGVSTIERSIRPDAGLRCASSASSVKTE